MNAGQQKKTLNLKISNKLIHFGRVIINGECF